MKRKKAVSPVISTVLLIMIAIMIAIIILLWARGFIKESITKEISGTEKRVDKLCSEVEIQSSIRGSTVIIENIGNIPINSIKIKTTEGGSSDIQEIDEGISPGEGITIDNELLYGFDYTLYEEVKIIPTLLGKSEEGRAEKFECPERDGRVV